MAMLLLVALLMLTMTPAAGAQPPTSPLPSGNRIVVQDGDVVIVDNDARIRVVRRREAQARVVFNADERWLVILVDDATAGPPDGRVDTAYYYSDLRGPWPFDPRWEGAATIEEYSTIPPRGGGGLGIVTSQGLVQFLGREQEFRDPDAVAVLSFMGAGGGGANWRGFDETERWLIAQVRRKDGVMEAPPGTGISTSQTVRPVIVGGVIGGVTGGITGGVNDSGVQVDANGAMRVGGRVPPPKKIADVRPAIPEDAARAGIRGVVIMEVTIDVDGTVKDARVLRSIPMLDAAALDAVRQWRYEPTTIDGKSVPVIMTVTIAFQ